MQTQTSNVPAVFNFNNQQQVRTTVKDGEPWFVARDVALILGYKNTAAAVSAHCKASSSIAFRDGTSGNPLLTCIPERDLYRLIMRSKLPSAERFEEWVVADVLPQLRKAGSYGVSTVEQLTVSQMFELMAKKFSEMEDSIAQLKSQPMAVTVEATPLQPVQQILIETPARIMRDTIRNFANALGKDISTNEARCLGMAAKRATLKQGTVLKFKTEAHTGNKVGYYPNVGRDIGARWKPRFVKRTADKKMADSTYTQETNSQN